MWLTWARLKLTNPVGGERASRSALEFLGRQALPVSGGEGCLPGSQVSKNGQPFIPVVHNAKRLLIMHVPLITAGGANALREVVREIEKILFFGNT